jgi:hypothetical protein
MYQFHKQPHSSPRRPSDPRVSRSASWLATVPLATVLVIGGFLSEAQSAQFSEAEVFFELNNTDGDLGIHASIDGAAYERLVIKDSDKNVLLEIEGDGNLASELGLTQLFFESAEPPFDELDPSDFFDLWPEGMYEVTAETLEGPKLKSKTKVTHTMPAPPGGITVGPPALPVAVDPESVDCDDEGTIPEVSGEPITISWAEVTMSHPDPNGGGAGIQPAINYEVVVEVETGGGFASIFSVILPPEERSMTIPAEVVALGDEFKFEILARETSFNQTAIESCFIVVE